MTAFDPAAQTPRQAAAALRAPQAGALEGVLSRLVAGEPGAMQELYDRTCLMVYTLAERLLRDPFQAEEAVLDVYRYAWKSARLFDPSRGSVHAWLLSITRGRSIDRLRATASRQQREQPLSDSGAGEPVDHEPRGQRSGSRPEDKEAEAKHDPAEQALAREKQDALTQALASLPPHQRRVIELAFLYGKTHPMIAKELNEPLGTIKSQIRRGLLRLHDLMIPTEAEEKRS